MQYNSNSNYYQQNNNEQRLNPYNEQCQRQQTYQSPRRERFDLNAKDISFALITVVLSIMNVSLGLWGGFRLGFTVSYILTFAAFSIYLINKDTHIKIFPLSCAVLAVAGSAVFMVGSNFSVKFWMFAVLFALSAVWFDSLACQREEKGDLGIIRNVFVSTFGGSFANLANSSVSLFSGRSKLKLSAKRF